MPLIFLLNGANLNMLGIREPSVYGLQTLESIRTEVLNHAKRRNVDVDFRQTNHEGELINAIHEAYDKADGIIINPGGFTRTSVSILDALKAVALPCIELHLSNTYRREAYRGSSFVSYGVDAIIIGFGGYGYILALDGMIKLIRGGPAAT